MWIRLLIMLLVIGAGCTPKQTRETRGLQTFTPVMVDMTKVKAADYTEIVAAVNAAQVPNTNEYQDARVYKEEAMFMYVRVYSAVSTGCIRVTVDKNRSRILNMQPDCAIEE